MSALAHDCQTCGERAFVRWCAFCDDHHCVECPRGIHIFTTTYCDQECQDAHEVKEAMVYDGPKCVICGVRSDRYLGGQTRCCSGLCELVWWKSNGRRG